jgi:hypothetical protein
MNINRKIGATFLGSIATLLSPVLVTFSSVQAASGEFSGTWMISRDNILDGKVTTTAPATNYQLNLNSHGNKFVGSYIGIQNDSIYEGETYFDPARTVKVIDFRQRGNTYYVVHSGKWIAANQYQGTWYDNDGNSGDFSLKKQ